jgi:hypothetical protein
MALVGWARLLSGAEALPTISVLDEFNVVNDYTALLIRRLLDEIIRSRP